MPTREFSAFIKILGWHCFSLGIHIDLRAPHVSIHFPGGFALLGWRYYDPNDTMTWEDGMYGIG